MKYAKNKPFITHEIITNVSQYKSYTMVLAKGYAIGSNINGYIVIKPNQKGYNYKRNYAKSCDIHCHGGITFDKYDDDNNRVIGFDTTNDNDFVNPKHLDTWNSNKWTTAKLFNECKVIVNQLKNKATLKFKSA